MKSITRAVGLDEAADLLANPPRAHIAYVTGGVVDAVAVEFRYDGEAWRVRLPARCAVPTDGDVSLLIDEGRHYFELRGIRARGTLGPEGRDGWRELRVDHVTGWDYGTLHRREGRT